MNANEFLKDWPMERMTKNLSAAIFSSPTVFTHNLSSSSLLFVLCVNSGIRGENNAFRLLNLFLSLLSLNYFQAHNTQCFYPSWIDWA